MYMLQLHVVTSLGRQTWGGMVVRGKARNSLLQLYYPAPPGLCSVTRALSIDELL